MTTVVVTEMPPTITRKLRGLRRSIFFGLAAAGLSVVWIVVVLMGAVSLMIDWMWRLDLSQRVFVLVIAAAVLAVAAYRRLIRPLIQPLSDRYLCAFVEAAHPELGQSLLAAVELSRLSPSESAGVSAGMIRAAIDEGVQRTRLLDFRDAIHDRFRKRTGAVVGVAAVLLAAVSAAFAVPMTRPVMRLWFERNVLLGVAEWPKSTLLSIRGSSRVGEPVILVPQGEDLEQFVDAEGVIPGVVRLDMKSIDEARASEPVLTQEMTRVGEDAFHFVFRNVLTPFRFRARGGDDQTGWVEVRLVDRPRVEDLRLVYTPPAYTGLEAVELPAGQASYDVLKGGSIDVLAGSNKPLRKMVLHLPGEPALEIALQDQTQSAGRETRVSGAEGAAADSSYAGRLGPEQLRSGVYRFGLFDMEGLAGNQRATFSVRVVADQKPKARARLEGVAGLVTPRAVVPVDCVLADDYAVMEAAVVMRRGQQDQDLSPAETLPMSLPAGLLGKPSVSTVHRMELLPMRFSPGDRINLQVEAKDNDTYSGPNVGLSESILLRVVADDELRAEIVRLEQEQHRKFEVMLKNQEDLQAETRIVRSSLRGSSDWEADRQKLGDIEKRQRRLAEQCSGMTDDFAQILAQIMNNDLEDANGPTYRRLQEHVVTPLAELAGVLMSGVADRVRAARETGLDAGAVDGAIAEAVGGQELVIAEMRRVLRYMEKWETMVEVIRLLQEMLKAQGDVTDATKKELDRRIEAVFGVPPAETR